MFPVFPSLAIHFALVNTRDTFYVSLENWFNSKTVVSFCYSHYLFWRQCWIISGEIQFQSLQVAPILIGELCLIILPRLFAKRCLLLFSCTQNFLFKCMGVLLNKISHKDFVHGHLNIMFNSVKHSSQVEREVRNKSFPLSFTI